MPPIKRFAPQRRERIVRFPPMVLQRLRTLTQSQSYLVEAVFRQPVACCGKRTAGKINAMYKRYGHQVVLIPMHWKAGGIPAPYIQLLLLSAICAAYAGKGRRCRRRTIVFMTRVSTIAGRSSKYSVKPTGSYIRLFEDGFGVTMEFCYSTDAPDETHPCYNRDSSYFVRRSSIKEFVISTES